MIDRDFAKRFLTGALEDGPHPASVGKKFASDGAVLHLPGNTTICHVDPSSDAWAALVEAQEALKAGPLAGAFSFLPPQSFHMTIFEGVIEGARARTRWPAHLPLDAPIDAVTLDLKARVTDLGLAQGFAARPVGVFGGFSVTMTGDGPDCEATLRRTRDQLRAATGLSRPDHDAYRFHVTLGYLLRWLSQDEAEAVLDLSDEVSAGLVARMPRLALGPVEFCRFDTMHHFERLTFLR